MTRPSVCSWSLFLSFQLCCTPNRFLSSTFSHALMGGTTDNNGTAVGLVCAFGPFILDAFSSSRTSTESYRTVGEFSQRSELCCQGVLTHWVSQGTIGVLEKNLPKGTRIHCQRHVQSPLCSRICTLRSCLDLSRCIVFEPGGD